MNKKFAIKSVESSRSLSDIRPESQAIETVVNAPDAAEYINEISAELREIAVSVKLSFLAYLLELVIEESAKKSASSRRK